MSKKFSLSSLTDNIGLNFDPISMELGNQIKESTSHEAVKKLLKLRKDRYESREAGRKLQERLDKHPARKNPLWVEFVEEQKVLRSIDSKLSKLKGDIRLCHEEEVALSHELKHLTFVDKGDRVIVSSAERKRQIDSRLSELKKMNENALSEIPKLESDRIECIRSLVEKYNKMKRHALRIAEDEFKKLKLAENEYRESIQDVLDVFLAIGPVDSIGIQKKRMFPGFPGADPHGRVDMSDPKFSEFWSEQIDRLKRTGPLNIDQNEYRSNGGREFK